MVLGVVDVATRFHQAAILKSREPQDAYNALEMIWLRPFGLMVQIGVDPVLRTVLEKMVATFSATEVADLELLLASCCELYDPLPGGLLTDSNSLASRQHTNQ